jgi:3'-phosphoadenosine 5'-phosphosulfate sulfotransferase (PAPS reductase)/FAD synthetase
MKVKLNNYDWVVINTSGGKDSQVLLDEVVRVAKEQGFPLDRIVAVHADLGRVEWKGTKELAEEQVKAYGLRFEVVKRTQNDLLDHVLARGKWPSNKARYCTSEHKRGPVGTLFTRLVREAKVKGRRVRILNVMGMRAQESSARAKLLPFRLDKRNTNGKRVVHVWLPIHGWTVDQVWERIKATGILHHYAYDLGMPRLSCAFCIFAPKSALLLAGKHNPELLNEYVAVEEKIGHSFRINLPIAEIKHALDRGEEPEKVCDWKM